MLFYQKVYYMKLLKKLDLEIVNKLRLDGYIKTNVHPSGDLIIYNYTEKCMFDKAWCDYTLQCRGLIADNEGNIVSRPFPKFFNLGEGAVPDEIKYNYVDVDIYEKLDGSLGVSYWYNGLTYIATRGSFTSRQAVYASDMLEHLCLHDGINPEHTYLFEIIYPENRVVVNYRDRIDLVLLAVIDTKDGHEYPAHMFECNGFSVVKKYELCPVLNGRKDLEYLKNLNEKNKEGFVLHYPKTGLRVKIKFEDYVKLHSIVTQVTKRKVWEMCKDGKSFYEFIEQIPDELFGWIRETEESLKNQYNCIEGESRVLLDDILVPGLNQTRKDIAQKIVKCNYGSVMFRMLDNKDYSQCIWKILEPAHEVPVIDGSQFYGDHNE